MTGCPETELIMQIAWRDCLLWSIGSKEPDFVASFEGATGNKFHLPAKSGIEAMIDAATGAADVNAHLAGLYVEWFNENVWGSTFRDAVEETL